jgi:hypothetical protein
VFGGNYIDLVNSGSGRRSLAYVGLDNFSRNGAFTVLIRIIPNFTGAPASTLSLFNVGPVDGNNCQGIRAKITTGQKLNVVMGDGASSTAMNEDSTSNIPLTSGTPTDIWFTYTGTSGASSFNMFAAQDGNSPTSIGSKNGGVTIGSGNRLITNVASIMFGTDAFASYANHGIIECCIWDTVETPSSHGVRTDFITASAFEGYNYTDPGIANVRSGTGYTHAGVAKTGTAVIPSLANTKTGVAGDGGTGTYDGSDRWTSPLASQLLSGVQLKSNSTSNNLTGTLAAALTADEIADAVWDGLLTDHGVSGSFGERIQKLLKKSTFLGR